MNQVKHVDTLRKLTAVTSHSQLGVIELEFDSATVALGSSRLQLNILEFFIITRHGCNRKV